MKIQSSNVAAMGYIKTLKNKEAKEQNLSHLMLDEDELQNNKPKFVVRNEGGYIRKYVVKANGDEILVMETKQKENPDGTVENESGNLVDIAHDKLMKQLELSSNPQMRERETKATWEKESGITKYKTGI
ncbi:hypothetical protein [Sporosarcina koreensis]|uniref:hypothetical protein n=1 Tax=Bacillales TaxID=1385 RepID=UPI00075DBDA2|nr:hypothetical protein [Sporosarcina koreensis]